MEKKFLLLIWGMFLVASGFAQTGVLKGRITLPNQQPVELLNVGFQGTNIGTATDSTGNYHIEKVPFGNYILQVSGVGYQKFTQRITINSSKPLVINIEIKENLGERLDEVVVTGTMKAVSKLESPVPVELYTPAFFKKNPTPVLLEALQIVNGVRPQLNCSVCNTGDIHINGMEGAYTMILIDGMPIVSGLSTVYGMSGIPNSMIDRIEIVKGPASTLYGSEAVAGLINVITKNPEGAPLVSFDIMGSTWQEYNVDFSYKLKTKKLSNLLGINYFNYENPIDNNNDNFTDITLQDRISIFNKLSLQRKNNRIASLAFRYVYEDRWGGELNWKAPKHRGGDEIYGESIYTDRAELIGSYQLPIQSQKMLFNFSLNSHNQNSVYGDTQYNAIQRIGFGQLLWDKKWSKTHDILMGLTMRYTYYDDNTPATRSGTESNYKNKPDEIVLPGIFLQDEIRISDETRLLVGARYDYHSEHGNIFSPRINLKWSPNRDNIFRLSAGNGFRVVNLFTEDHAATSGDRQVIIEEELNPEKSFNVNLNYQKFINFNKGFVSLDGTVFYTYFTNKIIADYDTDPNSIFYNNLDGHAISQGVTLNTNWNFDFPLRINAGITLMDVYETEPTPDGGEEKIWQVQTERISGTFTVSYTFTKAQITLDYSGNFYGKMRLPILENDYRPEYSKPFSLQNIQITKKFRNGLEIYGGIKNLLNFTPSGDILMRAFDPFDKTADDPVNNPNGYTFDANYNYAPNQGIRGFFGIRYSFDG